MNSRLLTFLLFLIASCSYGQIRFEKGYFISNDERRVECFIKNSDWKNNPTEITFMKKDSGIVETGDISSIREFGIYGFSRYIRAEVQIDRSGNDLEKLTGEKNPVWLQETLFLKVILEGKASLYFYEDGSILRFFYSSADKPVTQLIYRQYLADNTVMINNGFQRQLWMNVRCSNTRMSEPENLTYTLKDLEKYFTKYSQCFGDSIVKYENRTKREVINLKITTGLNLSALSAANTLDNTRDMDFKNNVSFRFGIESEFIMPFNMNKWGLVIEPTFQYFKAEGKLMYEKAVIKYSSVEFPVGIRHYFFLNPESKLFLDGFYISNYCLNFNPQINFINTYSSSSLKFDIRNSFAFGGGIEYKRFSTEIRYYTNRDLLSSYPLWSSAYTRLSIILGYKLIKSRHSS